MSEATLSLLRATLDQIGRTAGTDTMDAFARHYFEHEARALLTRLARIRPFVLSQVMVPAANISPAALAAVEKTLATGRRALRARVFEFQHRLAGSATRRADPALVQRHFAMLRLRFGAVLTQFDLFHDALAQRSDRDTGLWLAGLDALATDALALPSHYDAPPLLCYLDRGIGAAIRRARTRLPGGGHTEAAVIRVPRERLLGSAGLASSIVHEVGHQSASLLRLVETLGPQLRVRSQVPSAAAEPWLYWERVLSEVLADAWSVGRIGVGSTLGLLGVVSLPRAFVFRVNLDDPHPFPWIRVKLSCAIGAALFPHPQWQAISRLWESLYPLQGLPQATRRIVQALERTLPEFAALLLAHRSAALHGHSLATVLRPHTRTPDRLTMLFAQWRRSPRRMAQAPPCLAMAALAQARVNGVLGPREDGRIVHYLLEQWALQRHAAGQAVGPQQVCRPPQAQRRLSTTTSLLLRNPTGAIHGNFEITKSGRFAPTHGGKHAGHADQCDH